MIPKDFLISNLQLEGILFWFFTDFISFLKFEMKFLSLFFKFYIKVVARCQICVKTCQQHPSSIRRWRRHIPRVFNQRYYRCHNTNYTTATQRSYPKRTISSPFTVINNLKMRVPGTAKAPSSSVSKTTNNRLSFTVIFKPFKLHSYSNFRVFRNFIVTSNSAAARFLPQTSG